MGKCGPSNTSNLLNTVNYVSLPYLPAAHLTVLFLGWQIRKLFILNDSQRKSQVANFSAEMHEV
jgi:hypothetical protein